MKTERILLFIQGFHQSFWLFFENSISNLSMFFSDLKLLLTISRIFHCEYLQLYLKKYSTWF